MSEEFEQDLIGVLQKHFGENFDYNWDGENPIVALDLETNKKGACAIPHLFSLQRRFASSLSWWCAVDYLSLNQSRQVLIYLKVLKSQFW